MPLDLVPHQSHPQISNSHSPLHSLTLPGYMGNLLWNAAVNREHAIVYTDKADIFMRLAEETAKADQSEDPVEPILQSEVAGNG